MKSKQRIGRLVIYILLSVYVIVTMSPLLIVLSSSFRTIKNMNNPLMLFQELSLESYIKAFNNMNYLPTLLNSVGR